MTEKINPFTDEPESDSTLAPRAAISARKVVGYPVSPIQNVAAHHRLTITHLFIVTFMTAVTLAAVRQFYLAGTVTLFAVFLIASGIVSYRVQDESLSKFILEVIWGFLMPIACIVTDPFIFMEDHGTFTWSLLNIAPRTALAYSAFGWQILNLVASWFLAGGSRDVRAWFSGTFMVGAIFAFLTGLVISPFAIIGLIVIIGAVGFTPWFTGYVYIKAGFRYWPTRCEGDDQATKSTWLIFFAAILTSVLLPLAVYFLRAVS